MSRLKKILVVVLGGVVLLTVGLIIGAVALAPEETQEASQTEGKQPARTSSVPEVATSQPEVATPQPEVATSQPGNQAGYDSTSTSGRGSDALQVGFRPGVITFSYSYQDEGEFPGHFAIELLDEQGNSVALIANNVGTTEGSKSVPISMEGTYFVNVTADQGSWTLEATG